MSGLYLSFIDTSLNLKKDKCLMSLSLDLNFLILKINLGTECFLLLCSPCVSIMMRIRKNETLPKIQSCLKNVKMEPEATRQRAML